MEYRIEKDSMGELEVPKNAYWGAQTQRAVNNFPISGQPLPSALIEALAHVKHACAAVNKDIGWMSAEKSTSIQAVADRIIQGDYADQFPVDVFQTGSGTSSNMNMNEVISNIANEQDNLGIHPNDDVNMGQSSNDVFPSALQLAAAMEIHKRLLPALQHLHGTIVNKANEVAGVTKTGRTHLMDAMPIQLSQELQTWADQIEQNIHRIESSLPRLQALPIGGTAVGTGINAHPEMGPRVATYIASATGVSVTALERPFMGISAQDSSVEMSGQLKTTAVSLMKIANDLRWMNSGPLAGLGEIELPSIQPGSSIMPGKVNPVIPEAVAMASAQVIGNDTAITIGGQSGNFQLNVMLPMIARNLIESIQLLSQASIQLADVAIKDFNVRQDNIDEALFANPILVTALNSVIGYEKGAAIAKKAYAEQRPILDVALELTDLSEDELKTHLNPEKLTTNKGA